MRARPSADPKRCAIYTRNSKAAGLEQDFKSLDSQRDACLAYIQQLPGWMLVESSRTVPELEDALR